jgi:hypothetical protein
MLSRIGLLFMALAFLCLSVPIGAITLGNSAYPCCYAQNTPKVQALATKILVEPGCPVSIQDAHATLEIDPFQTPVALQIYLNYKNDASQPVQAVKFRVEPMNGEGTAGRSYQASVLRTIACGQDDTQLYRREGIDPKTAQVQVRIVEVKFADNSLWQSPHLHDARGAAESASGNAKSEEAGQQ